MEMKKLKMVLAAACALTSFWGCGGNSGEKLIQKAAVKYVDLRDVVAQTGLVQPVDKVELKSEASGIIDTLYVKEGERLKKGERILKIDPTRLLTSRQKLDLALQKAKLNYALTKRDYENAQALFKGGNLSQNKVEDLKNQFELSDISLKENELELNDVEYQLSKTTIVSPMEGVLISLLVERGEIAVSATSGFSGGTAIGTVADVSRLEVITQIGEVDYAKLKMGQTASLNLESDSKVKTAGRITFISLSAKKDANSNISSFEVRVSIDSLIPGLVPGVNVNVDFVILEKKHVLGVPCAMVDKQESGNIYTVFRPRDARVPPEFQVKPGEFGKEKRKERRPSMGGPPDNKAQEKIRKKIEAAQAAIKKMRLVRQRIQVGETDYQNYEILGGLSPGDTIIKVIENEQRTD